ncbi:LPP20 family lipoprotein [Ferrimonas pelagia]|uniref:Lipoprotein LPP20-like domain-containing protein n=1 Tax=Ferrimonas pelagia TaxID=1177826 RepID=A0ABP9FBQ8_9GAMM
MQKTIFLPIIFSGLLWGCSSNQDTVLQCTFPDAADQAAPAWVCDESLKGYALTGVGFAKQNPAGIGFMKDVASNDARVKMAQAFRTQVAAVFRQSVSVTGSDGDDATETLIESASRNVTEQALSGTRVIKSRTSPSGAMYVLIGMSDADYERTLKNAISVSKTKDSELWQRFKEEKAIESLEALMGRTNKL